MLIQCLRQNTFVTDETYSYALHLFLSVGIAITQIALSLNRNTSGKSLLACKYHIVFIYIEWFVPYCSHFLALSSDRFECILWEQFTRSSHTLQLSSVQEDMLIQRLCSVTSLNDVLNYVTFLQKYNKWTVYAGLFQSKRRELFH